MKNLALKKAIPKSCERFFRKVKYFGKAFYCPVCKSHLRNFFPIGDPPRPNILCPICYSKSRHRLVWLLFQGKTNLLDSSKKKMLHVAPEKCLEDRLMKFTNIDYLTTDLFSPNAMVKMDLLNIQYPDNKFDVIYCSHVLQAISDDIRAMQEIYRVLTYNGYTIIQVPINTQKTVINFLPVSMPKPIDRNTRGEKKLDGSSDKFYSEHIHLYGPDFEMRLAKAGFEVKVFKATDITSIACLSKMGIRENELIFYCTKS